MNRKRFKTLRTRRLARRVTVVVTLAVAVALIASVAASARHTQSYAGPNVSGQTITVLDNAAHPQFKAVWAKIPSFEKQYGVKVNLVLGSTTADTEQKALQAVELGNGGTYDVVTIPDEITATASKFMTDLAPLITASGGTVKAFQSPHPAWAQKADTYGGKLIYAPFYAGAHAVVYRVGLFKNSANKSAFYKRYHYPLPNPPKTPKQLMDVAQFFTHAPGKYGIVLPGQGALGGGLSEEMFFLSGLNYTTTSGKALWSPSFKSNVKLAVQAITWYQTLAQKYAPSQFTGMASTSAAAFFDECNTAMYMDLSYLTWGDVAASQGKCGPVSSFAIPTFTKNGGHIVSFWMHGIPANSAHKQAAFDFIQWVDTAQNLELAAEGTNGTFIPTDATVRKAVLKRYTIPYGVAQAVEGGLVYPILPTTVAYRNEVNTLNEKLMGGLSPRDFVKGTAEAINSINHVSG